MALDPNILLQRTTPNLMQALQSGISAGQSLRQAPILEALQKQKLAEAQKIAERNQLAQQESQRLGSIQQQKEKGAFVNRLAATLKGVPPDQRASVISQNQQALQAFGVDQSSLSDLSDQSLDQAIAATSVFAPAAQQPKTATLSEGQILVDERTGREIASGGQKQKDIQPKVNTLRSVYNNFSKDLVKVDASARKIETASDNAQGDMSLIFGFMKLLDPGSTVREGEFQNAEVTEGIPGRILNIRNKLLSGERLNEAQRQAFKDEAKKLVAAQQDAFDNQTALVLQQADQDEVPREKIIGTNRLREFEKRAADKLIQERAAGKAASSQFAEGQTATGPNGEKIKYVNGQWVPM